MAIIPANPADQGYFNITNYTLEQILFLETRLTLCFKKDDNHSVGLNINLDHAISYDFKINANKFSFLRVDNDGSSYGWDISIRLKQPKYKGYMVIYLFEDERHTTFLFRGLAETIYVERIEMT